MLAALAIRDIVIIEKLDLEFGPGLTVLTGETGAGKSILLDALSLALGARGDAGLVRDGAAQGQVTAVFELAPEHRARALLVGNGIADTGELVIRRVQGRDGRTKSFVNGEPVSHSLLSALGGSLVEIHGQHDARALIEPSLHRSILDVFGGLEADAVAIGQAWREWRQAETSSGALRLQIEEGRRHADYLRSMVEELRLLAPRDGEEDDLATRRQLMMRAEKVAGDLADAHAVVAGEASPVPILSSLLRRLERKRAEAGGLLDPAVAAIDRALTALGEAGASLEDALRQSEFDPRDLERTEERLFALRAASRKHNVPVAALPALSERMAAELGAIRSGEQRLAELAAAAAEAKGLYEAAALALSAARRARAGDLQAAVMAELPALKLERAKFLVEMTTEPDAPGEAGIDRVEFWVRTNPGSRPGPLMKVASGGELSRFLLALKVALARRGSAPTLIFDEVDTAVGGAVSDAIGQRLGRLAAGAQVLAITHAPQVAARADRHLLIVKSHRADEDRMVTEVVELDAAHRREEIARMLAGTVVTDEARAAAARLLVGAA